MKFLLPTLILILGFIACKPTSKQTNTLSNDYEDLKKIAFSANDLVISPEEAIDSVVITKLQMDETRHFAVFQDLNIAPLKTSLLVDADNRNELLSVTYDGKVSSVVKGGYRDTIFPKELRYFCVTPDSQNIFVIDPNRRCLYKYSPSGILLKTIYLPNDEFRYYRVFALSETEFVLVILSNARDDEKGRRDSSHVASIFNTETKQLKRLYVKGGSPSRDRIVMANWYKGDGKIIYNYQNSRIIHEVSNGQLLPKYEIQCPEHIADDEVLAMDNQPFVNNNDILIKLAKSGRILHFLSIYETDNILFFVFGHNFKAHWVFYNLTKDEFKVVKFETTGILTTVKGKPFTPSVHNGYKNSFLHFWDGEELQGMPGIKDNYDPNKSYLVRIYPKYLNQASWEK